MGLGLGIWAAWGPWCSWGASAGGSTWGGSCSGVLVSGGVVVVAAGLFWCVKDDTGVGLGTMIFFNSDFKFYISLSFAPIT